MSSPTQPESYVSRITEEMTRRNGWIFLVSYLLIYFAAPAIYIGIVQAALIDKLGASSMMANLPLSAYKFGSFAPLVVSWLAPHRFEKHVIVWANIVTASVLTLVLLTLVLPVSSSVRIGALIVQGLVQGLSGSTSMVFQLQCLTRGTTSEGRIRVLKRTFSLTPLAAVAGSLFAQWLLDPQFAWFDFPYDFAMVYLVAIPCIAGVAYVSTRYDLAPLEDEPRRLFFGHLFLTVKEFASSRSLTLAWFAYLLWYMTLAIIPNLSLYSKEALGADPQDYSGIMMALRFGCKALGGYVLGWIAMRYGLRGSAFTAVALLAAGILWGWSVPGFPYLLAFGFIGAGELGGTYFPNFVAVLSSAEAGTRNLALVQLAPPVSSFAPTLHGALADTWGFPASFVFGLIAAAIAMVLVSRIRERGGGAGS